MLHVDFFKKNSGFGEFHMCVVLVGEISPALLTDKELQAIYKGESVLSKDHLPVRLFSPK